MLTSLFHCSPSCPPRSSSSCSLLPEVCLLLLLFLSANQLQRAIMSKPSEDQAHKCTACLLLWPLQRACRLCGSYLSCLKILFGKTGRQEEKKYWYFSWLVRCAVPSCTALEKFLFSVLMLEYCKDKVHCVYIYCPSNAQQMQKIPQDQLHVTFHFKSKTIKNEEKNCRWYLIPLKGTIWSFEHMMSSWVNSNFLLWASSFYEHLHHKCRHASSAPLSS